MMPRHIWMEAWAGVNMGVSAVVWLMDPDWTVAAIFLANLALAGVLLLGAWMNKTFAEDERRFKAMMKEIERRRRNGGK